MNDFRMTADGKLDISQLIFNQHTKRIIDQKESKFNPRKDKILELPVSPILQIIPLFKLGIIIFNLKQDIKSGFYIVNYKG